MENLKKNYANNQRKDEIFLLDEFINRYKNDEQYNDKLYFEMFKILIETRLVMIHET